MSFGTEPIEIIYLEMIKNIVRIYILRRKNGHADEKLDCVMLDML